MSPRPDTTAAADDAKAEALLEEASMGAGRRSTQRKTLALIAAGLVVVGYMLYRVGVGEVAALLASLGWAAPVILVPYAVGAVFDVAGWARALVGYAHHVVSFWRLYAIRLVGEAVNNLTPTAGLAGEPIKAYLLRAHGVATGAGVASVMIAKTALIIGQILFTLTGVVLFADEMGLLGDRAVLIVAAWIIGLGIAVIIVAGQRANVVTRGARLLRRLGLRGATVQRIERRASEIDGALADFYRNDPRGFALAVAYHVIAWLIGVAEVFLLLHLMGVSCTWRQAFVIESITQATMAAGAIVLPGGLGVHELGGAVLCRILGIGEVAGLALMLLKRIREITFSLIGMAILPYLSRAATEKNKA